MQQITEGKAKLKIHKGKPSKKLKVFYNPVMELNRTLSVLLLKAIDKKYLQIALPLAGTGVRGIRFIRELPAKKIKRIDINDHDKNAFKSTKDNLSLNNIKSRKVRAHNEDAEKFLLDSKGFDYIDIDPFGTPNPFLDSSIKRLSRDSILAVTATDTSALCGTYPKSCARKYFAKHEKNPIMHEIGLRILIRKVQLIAAQYERALKPIFSYSKDHYMRVFFSCGKSKEKTNDIIKKHHFFNDYGPIWTGKLMDSKIVKKMHSLAGGKEEKFLSILAEESKIPTVGYYHLHKLCKAYGIKVPKTERIFREVSRKGYSISKTHFSDVGVRSNIPLEKLMRLIKKLNK